MKVVHLITGLEIGGANMMLYKLLAGAQSPAIASSVIVLMDRGQLGERIEALGVPLYALGMSRGRLSLTGFAQLRRTIAGIDPDLIQAWTYPGNIAASLAALIPPGRTVFWNIRHTPYDLSLSKYGRLTYLLIRYGKWLSWQPAYAIFNSRVSAQKHRKLGYRYSREVVIPNGFDVEKFAPSAAARAALREELGLPPQTRLVGMVARYHPMKDHASFLQAAALCRQRMSGVHFVLVGEGLDEENVEVVSLCERLGLHGRVHLLGRRMDVAKITAGFDIATLSSAWGDAFPNVVGEAMACGIPCVVTDVGDSAFIVGDTGIVVPPRDAEALCRGWKQLLDMHLDKLTCLGRQARQRIVEKFSLDKIVAQYEALYLEEVKRSRS